jgi:hypothetical protein
MLRRNFHSMWQYFNINTDAKARISIQMKSQNHNLSTVCPQYHCTFNQLSSFLIHIISLPSNYFMTDVKRDNYNLIYRFICRIKYSAVKSSNFYIWNSNLRSIRVKALLPFWMETDNWNLHSSAYVVLSLWHST